MSSRLERRLGDIVLRAFDLACDQRDIDTARQLIAALDHILAGPPAGHGERRRGWPERLRQAHDRFHALERSIRATPARARD